MAADPTSWTTLALLLRPQGRKGELLAELLTDFPERFGTAAGEARRRVFLAKPAFGGTAAEARATTVLNHWLPTGKNAGRIVLQFEGIDSINAAETLEGLEVIVPDEARVPLPEDEQYIDDLIGCRVFDGASEGGPLLIGTVTGIDFPTTPDGTRRLPDVAPLLTVETAAGEEVLIPYVNDFLIRLDVTEKRIDMQLPEGLVGINQGPMDAHDEEAE